MHFFQSWLNHVTYKRYHFAAVAQYRKSCEDSANNRYGDELGRLHVAQKYVDLGLKTPKKGVSQGVVIDIKVSDLKAFGVQISADTAWPASLSKPPYKV